MNMYPSARELLDAVADFLDDEVMAAVPSDLAHKVRVAANLARIVGRESDLAGEGVAAERSRLAALLGHSASLEDLRAELATRLRGEENPELDRAAWQVAVEALRDELAVVKPGHDSWEGK
jgi:hypothetical protein